MAATSKLNTASNSVKRVKSTTTNGTAEHTPSTTPPPSQDSLVEYGPGKPDRVLFDKEQEKVKAEIDALQAKLATVKDKIGLTSNSGSGNDRRTQLRNELDSIRAQQSNNKVSRTKVFDQLKQVQEGIQKKIKDLNASKAKTKFKTVAEVNARISDLERQVESGSMKLADEKRALLEITQTRRIRKTVESFQAEQDSIDRDKATEEEIRKQLDDPEAKAISERYEVLKAEFDELKREGDEAFANRGKLMGERSVLQTELDTLYNLKRDSAQRFRDANDRHWQKVNEDRARRAEKARAQRAAEEDAKKQEIINRLREEASQPAYQLQIEDCQTLIDSFSKGTQASEVILKSISEKADVAGVPKLELRKLDAAAADGLVVRKKKGEEEQSYFVGAKGKKGKKAGAKTNGSTEPAAPSTASQYNIPLPTLSALLSLSIPPPTSTADMTRVVEDLETKKAWFEANQARVTRERVAKAEVEIQRLTGGTKTNGATPESWNGEGEYSPEALPTSQDKGIPSTAVPDEEVVDILEHVQEDETAELES